uniref:Uncharacterized protein n=1 Tax=Amphimedon queenslandica TaxID=400682 RepID=A0A1X7TQP3_AMPQE
MCGDLLEVVDRIVQSTSSHSYPQKWPHINPSNIGCMSNQCSLLDHSSAERPMEGRLDHVGGAGGTGPRAERRGPSMSSGELGRMFNFKASSSSPCSRKGKLKMWKHTFVCLIQPEQEQTPESMEKARLKFAGLGQKSCLVALNSDADVYLA